MEQSDQICTIKWSQSLQKMEELFVFNSEEQKMPNVKQVHIILRKISNIYPDYY